MSKEDWQRIIDESGITDDAAWQIFDDELQKEVTVGARRAVNVALKHQETQGLSTKHANLGAGIERLSGELAGKMQLPANRTAMIERKAIMDQIKGLRQQQRQIEAQLK